MTLHYVAITTPVEHVNRSFEQASAIETYDIVPDIYQVTFANVSGRPVDEENAYYAYLKVRVTNVMYSYKYEAMRPQPDGERTLSMYYYEFKAGRDFIQQEVSA